jgi:glycosyltransferase involved in cell wall biosynthesis
LHTANAFEHAAQFDLIHNHMGSFAQCFARLSPVPVVTTLHGSGAEPHSRLMYPRYADLPYVSITDAERSLLPYLNYVATVYNGIDLDGFTFVPAAGSYLLVLGRMSPDKGIHFAIDVAERTGMSLVLAGIVPPENRAYFEAQIQPRLSETIRFVGPADARRKAELYGGAAAFLHLITYDEAFGLTMVEAMACGCPVIAVRRGSVPELIADGETGYIVDDVEGAVAATERLGSLDRAACRRRVQQRFTVDHMVEGYLDVYRTVLAHA